MVEKLRKQKGKITNTDIVDKEIAKEQEEMYWKVKKLPKTEEIPNPYWNIYYLISPISMYSSEELKETKESEIYHWQG